MKKYIATYITEVEIECENIAQANRLAKRISTVHTDGSGWNRSGGKWSTDTLYENVKVRRKDKE